ncbi:hypothetical protein PsorP6_002050 [Peronosclerospora sorghi]|uniref:Uncharacterized protein n=1 Tax=Peronosclerospora sorghi TaxID=230839 RepID=A0ACC0WWR8_9STRA|nr:hypothetical protein PsorP6_002050 [Peronosclerospora sorghi]
MAKSLRSKIKRKFRTELRKRVGVPHQAVQEAKIQENLKRALEAQGTGSSVESLKKLIGAKVPVASSDITGVVNEQEAEGTLVNEEPDVSIEDATKAKTNKKSKKRKSKFQHFHQLRKKGV